MADWYANAYNDSWSKREDAAVADLIRGSLQPMGERGWVVDLGCGQGLGAALLPDSDYRIVGVDISAAMLKRFPQSERRHALRTDFRRLPFRDASIDGALSLFGSLSYTVDIDAVVRETARVLVPGAPFIVMLLSRFSLERVCKFEFSASGTYGSQGAPNGGVRAAFYTRSVRTTFEKYGLSVNRIVGQSPWRTSGRLESLFWKSGLRLCLLLPELGHALILVGRKGSSARS